MKLLLVYPPFCAPTVMPYSISYLKNFIENNLPLQVRCLDLNAKFHGLRFASFYEQLRQAQDINSYGNVLLEFENVSREVYAQNHRDIVHGKEPELLSTMVQLIIQEKPEVVAISLVYNSQCFYTLAIIQELHKKNIPVVLGGPAAGYLKEKNTPILKNEIELLQFLAKQSATPLILPEEKDYNYNTIPDFSDYSSEDYLSKEKIIPIKTTSTCFYKLCTFCTHYADVPYFEFSLENIKTAIVRSQAKHIYFIDDMISKPRLLQLAQMLKELKVTWWCQLRPMKDLIPILQELYASGLRAVCWGVESGNQRILDLMKKGTKVNDAAQVLKESHLAGIKNMPYVMFGFPSETKEEFLHTIAFLKENSEYIDLLCTSVFGLQKRSPIFKNPASYGIGEVHEKERTILSEKITYKVDVGMQNEETKNMRKRYKRTLRNLNKLPLVFDYFKEQVLIFADPAGKK